MWRTGNWRRQGAPEAHADGEVQCQEGFAAFGFAAQDAHRLIGPEAFDEPAGEGGVSGELAGALNREWVHGRLGLGLGSI